MNLFRKNNQAAVDLANRAKEAERHKKIAEHQERVDDIVNSFIAVLREKKVKLSELQNALSAAVKKVNTIEGNITVDDMMTYFDEKGNYKQPEEPAQKEGDSAEESTPKEPQPTTQPIENTTPGDDVAKRAAEKTLEDSKQ